MSSAAARVILNVLSTFRVGGEAWLSILIDTCCLSRSYEWPVFGISGRLGFVQGCEGVAAKTLASEKKEAVLFGVSIAQSDEQNACSAR